MHVCNHCPELTIDATWCCEACKKKLDSRIARGIALEDETKELQSRTEELQSRLNFLSQRFDNENADGPMKADVAISVQDETNEVLYAHKFVLAGKSPVFRKMFDVNMLESETGLVRIDDATLPVMRAVIEFCYTAEINFTDGVTFEEVLKAAHKYDIDLLVKTCEERLIPTIDKVNLPRMLKLAKKLGTKGLQAGALEYLKTHFDDVIVPFVDELV